MPEHHPVTFEDGTFRFPTLPRPRLAGVRSSRRAVRHGACLRDGGAGRFTGQGVGPASSRARFLNATEKGATFTIGKRRKRSTEETAKAVELLSIAGLTRREIAGKLGLSDKTVDNYFTALT